MEEEDARSEGGRDDVSEAVGGGKGEGERERPADRDKGLAEMEEEEEEEGRGRVRWVLSVSRALTATSPVCNAITILCPIHSLLNLFISNNNSNFYISY